MDSATPRLGALHGNRRAPRRALLGVLGVLAIAGGALAGGSAVTAGAADGGAVHADVTLRNAGGDTIGFANLTEDATGTLHVSVHAKGLTPGLHGIHIHNVGDCTAGVGPFFLASGSHHNPHGAQHGSENAAGPHAGDLPNLQVNAGGVGQVTTKLDLASLSAGGGTVFDTNGSALVIHAGPDDLVTDPTGNSGGRVACGVIEAN